MCMCGDENDLTVIEELDRIEEYEERTAIKSHIILSFFDT